jgi:hypothetical protein
MESPMRALINELRVLQSKQEGIWKGIKKAADTAVSAIPVVGGVYNAARAATGFNKAVGSGIVGAAQWATGHKKAAAGSFQKAKTAGVDAAGRGALAAISTVPGGGLAATAAKTAAKPLVRAGMDAANKVVATVPPVKKKKTVLPVTGESVLFPSTQALVEFRSLVGLPPVKK